MQATGDARRLAPNVLAERCDGYRVELDLLVPEDLAVFTGHFPAFPVVPGVLQVDWVMRFAQTLLNVGSATGAPAIKFSQLLRPGDRCMLTLERSVDGATLSFALRQGETTFATGRLSVEPR